MHTVRINKPISLGAGWGKFSQELAWCKDHLGEYPGREGLNWTVHSNWSPNGLSGADFLFEDEKTATLFALRWL